MINRSREIGRAFRSDWLILAGYVAFITVISFFHEFWRDELQAWMLVKESSSILELLENTRYEGHPSLWFFMLYALKGIAPGMWAMKLLHIGMASITAWLVVRYSPFTRLQKIMILAGYFFLYEYAVIARNYAPGLMFTFAACALFSKRQSPGMFLLYSLAVVGMMLSNVYAFFIGAALMVLPLADFFQREKTAPVTWKHIPGFIVMLGGIALFLADTIPPADSGYARAWHLEVNITHWRDLFARAGMVFAPVPRPGVQFWNGVFYTDEWVQAGLGVLILVLIILLFARKKAARGFILLLFFTLLSFSFLKFPGYLRHNGHLYIAFLVLLWINPALPGHERLSGRFSMVFLYVVLGIQAMAGMVAAGCEIAYPFSRAAETAAYLNGQHAAAVIIGHEDTGTSTVAAFLDAPVYYPASGNYGTYIEWNTARLKGNLTTSRLVMAGDSLARATGRQVIWLFTIPFDSADYYGLKPLAHFEPSVEPIESYWIFGRSDPSLHHAKHEGAKGNRRYN